MFYESFRLIHQVNHFNLNQNYEGKKNQLLNLDPYFDINI